MKKKIKSVPKGTKVEKLKDGKVKILANTQKENLSEDVADIWSEQEEFYFDTCTQCHAGHKVTEHTMNEWASIFGTMRGFAQLDDDEASNGLYAKDKKEEKTKKTTVSKETKKVEKKEAVKETKK